MTIQNFVLIIILFQGFKCNKTDNNNLYKSYMRKYVSKYNKSKLLHAG